MKKETKIGLLILLIVIIMGATTITNTSIITDQITTTTLNVSGNSAVQGNLTANFYYGEMWQNFEPSGITITLAGQDVFANITNFTANHLNGFTLEEGYKLIPQYSGSYKVDYGISFGGAGNSIYGFSVAINGVGQNNTHSERKTPNTDVGNTGSTGIIMGLNAGDKVTLMVKDQTAGINNPTVYAVNLNLIRVGD